jgi:hypothetical protein
MATQEDKNQEIEDIYNDFLMESDAACEALDRITDASLKKRTEENLLARIGQFYDEVQEFVQKERDPDFAELRRNHAREKTRIDAHQIISAALQENDRMDSKNPAQNPDPEKDMTAEDHDKKHQEAWRRAQKLLVDYSNMRDDHNHIYDTPNTVISDFLTDLHHYCHDRNRGKNPDDVEYIPIDLLMADAKQTFARQVEKLSPDKGIDQEKHSELLRELDRAFGTHDLDQGHKLEKPVEPIRNSKSFDKGIDHEKLSERDADQKTHGVAHDADHAHPPENTPTHAATGIDRDKLGEHFRNRPKNKDRDHDRDR